MSKIEPTESKSATISTDLDAFFAEMTKASTRAATGTGRLIFALDATMSRQPMWDTACRLQADMFREARHSLMPR